MSPKKKAIALKETFGDKAVLVVDEILISMPTYPRGEFKDWIECRDQADKYWESVKEEIENL